jgi:hypothetical protein
VIGAPCDAGQSSLALVYDLAPIQFLDHGQARPGFYKCAPVGGCHDGIFVDDARGRCRRIWAMADIIRIVDAAVIDPPRGEHPAIVSPVRGWDRLQKEVAPPPST